jgi:NAD(P)-dependent dehydrogenase (short-subunit alcohol dehydrogenase family)
MVAAAGAEVVCADRDRESAEAAARETGGTAWVGDATREFEVERLLAEASGDDTSLQGIHGIVDVVGRAVRKPLVDFTEDDWRSQLDVNLHHAYYLLRLSATRLSAGSSIVFISSVSGLSGANGHAPYGAAKAALSSLVRSAAVEFGPLGIRVNAIAPGAFTSPRLDKILPKATLETVRQAVPLGRLGHPVEVAMATMYLLSDLSSYVTGHTLVLDGGVSAKFPYPM